MSQQYLSKMIRSRKLQVILGLVIILHLYYIFCYYYSYSFISGKLKALVFQANEPKLNGCSVVMVSVTVTWVSDETLAGTLCRWSSLQSTVLAWWYTDWGVYQGLVSHTHCRGHSAAPPAGRNTHHTQPNLCFKTQYSHLSSWDGHHAFIWRLYIYMYIYLCIYFLPWMAPPTPVHTDDVTKEKRIIKSTANPMVHWGRSRADMLVQLWRQLPPEDQKEASHIYSWMETHTGSDVIDLVVQISGNRRRDDDWAGFCSEYEKTCFTHMFKNTEVTVKGFKTVQYFQLFYFYLCYNYVIFLIYFAAKLLFSYLKSFSSCVMFSYVTVVLCFAFSCAFSVYTQTCRHFHTTSLLYRVTEKNSKDFTHVYAHTGWVLPDAGPRGLA